MTGIVHGCITGLFCVLLCGQELWPQEGTPERLREAKFVVLTGPRHRRRTVCREGSEGQASGWQESTEQRASQGQSLHWPLLGEGRAGRGIV